MPLSYIRRAVLMLHLFFFTFLANAQKPAPLAGQAKIDSLLKELPKAKEDTNKCNILNDVSYNYRSVDPDEGIKYGQQDSALAARLGWKKGMAWASNVIGVNYNLKGDFPKALAYYNMALLINEEIHSKKGVANILGNIGRVYCDQGNYPKALEYDLKDLKIAEEMGDKKLIAHVTNNIGIVYYDQGDYPKALEYYFKNLKLAQEMGDKNSIGSANCNIGNVYFNQNDYDKALEYYFKDLKIEEEIGDKHGISQATGNIGNVYFGQGNYSRSLEYYFKGLKIAEEIGDKHMIAVYIGNIGSTYTKQKNYTMAIEYGKRSLKVGEDMGDRRHVAFALQDLGNAYLSLVTDTAVGRSFNNELPAAQYKQNGSIPSGKRERLRMAISYLQRGLDTAKQIKSREIMQDCYEDLAKAYKITGDYKRSLEAYQSYTTIKDSVFSQENQKKMMRSGMQYDYDKQHMADSMKASEKEQINRLELHRQRTYTWLGIAGGLLLLVFLGFVLRNNKLLGREKQISETERKKADDLLLNILPEEVAGELKNTGSSAARHFDNVTVLFTDFVNFTQASEKMSPQALIDELHTCFMTFDQVMTKYGIEKIKTIGDAYLAVAGLPAADPQHAEHIVSAAREIRDYMASRHTRLGDKTFEVRVGIHSGNVVAGIVGVKKFAYDIWGDTVNTAARMEQNSEAGKINISQATYELVKDKFTCEYRGEIEAKNKGGLKMYFVG